MPVKSMGPKKTKDTTPTPMDDTFVCPHCGRTLRRSEFYVSSDPAVMIGIAYPCKDCARNIARRYNPKTKMYAECTEESIKTALEYLDKPYLQTLWDTSYKEVHDATLQRNRNSIWDAYIKNVQMVNYRSLRWKDGDPFKVGVVLKEVEEPVDITDPKNQEIYNAYQINKKDAIRMIGYDPFQNYPVVQDLPVLYAQLINFIDEETKNDGMKMNAVIQIVQSFNQIQKLNDAINELAADPQKINTNNGTIKQHADTISKLLSGANALAKDNGISVNFNNSKSKGQNTLTGKMKDLDLIGFRAAKINTYDIDYCRGMQQVAEISAKAQIDQIGFDENTMSEINNIRRELIDDLQKQRDKAIERARILLVENKDLKEFLKEKGLIDEFGRVIDNE